MKSSIKRRAALQLLPRVLEDKKIPSITLLGVKDSNENLYSFLVKNGYIWHTKKRSWQPAEDPTSQTVISARVTRATHEKLLKLAIKHDSDISSIVRDILDFHFLPELPGLSNREKERNHFLITELKKMIEILENPTK